MRWMRGTVEPFIRTMRNGKHLCVGRPILPPRRWFDRDAFAMPTRAPLFAYLQTLNPIDNLVPAPIAPQ